MTEQNNTAEAEQTTPDAEQHEDDQQQEQPTKAEENDTGTSDDGESSPVRKARKEAASYRTRARDAETRAEALQQRVEALEWAEVERHLPKNSPRLDGLKKLGLELEEVKDDDGNISPEKVQTAVAAAAELVGVSLHPQPRMPLEGKSPNRLAITEDVESQLKQALGL